MYIRRARRANKISPLDMSFTKPRKPLARPPPYVKDPDLCGIVDMHLRINRLYKNDRFDFSLVDTDSSSRIDEFEANKLELYSAFNLERLIKSNSKLWVLHCRKVENYHDTVAKYVDLGDTRVQALLAAYPKDIKDIPSTAASEQFHIDKPDLIEAMHQNVVAVTTMAIDIDKQLWDMVKVSGNTDHRAVVCANNFESRVYPIVHPDMHPSTFVVAEGQAEAIDALIASYQSILEVLRDKRITCPEELNAAKNLTTFMILQKKQSQGLCVPYSDFVGNVQRSTLALRCYIKEFQQHSQKLTRSLELPESYHPNSLHPENAGTNYNYLDPRESAGGSMFYS